MRIWFGLIVAPLLALADLTVSFATVWVACAQQLTPALNVVHGAFLLAALGCTLAAWTAWRTGPRDGASGETVAQVQFLAGIATASGTLSTVAVAAMWMPVAMIGPCLS